MPNEGISLLKESRLSHKENVEFHNAILNKLRHDYSLKGEEYSNHISELMNKIRISSSNKRQSKF